MPWQSVASAAMAACLAAVTPLVAQPKAELTQETVHAFEQHARIVEQEFVEGASLAAEAGVRDRLVAGEVIVSQSDAKIDIPKALVHDWTAAAFVADVAVDDVANLLLDYDRHETIYAEVLEGGRLGTSPDGTLRSRLRLKKKKVITVVLETEHKVHRDVVSEDLVRIRSYSTSIREVRNADADNETLLPEGQDSGFLWRLNAYWNIRQTPGGVVVECRTLSLTRSIPFGFAWIVKPFVKALPRESLTSTLVATRAALESGGD